MFANRQLLAKPSSPFRICIRCASSAKATFRPVPPPTPFVPDVPTFLKVIGRGLSQHAAKITSWEALFKLNSSQLRNIGIEPPRARKYLLWWREKFRRGEYGIGGDLTDVKEGVGEIRVFEVPVRGSYVPRASVTTSEGMKKVALNVPTGETMPRTAPEQAQAVNYVKIKYDHTICGPFVQPVAGSNGHAARITAQEGIWEERRGHKVDGGERRKAEVRAKRRALERKAAEK